MAAKGKGQLQRAAVKLHSLVQSVETYLIKCHRHESVEKTTHLGLVAFDKMGVAKANASNAAQGFRQKNQDPKPKVKRSKRSQTKRRR